MRQTKRHGIWCVALTLAVAGLAPGADEKEQEKAKEDAPKVTTSRTENGKESRIRVLLPVGDARLQFDGAATKATGRERAFRSPALEDGKRYTYKVMAVWMENGREVNHETKIVFRAGEDVVVDFRH